MHRATLAYIIILLVFFSNLKAQKNNTNNNIVVKGVADLRNFDFRNDLCYLNGQWYFMPNEFVAPNEVNINEFMPIKVPQQWRNSNIKAVNNGLGYGTYHIKVKIPKTEDILAIRLTKTRTAYKLYFNDSLIATQGKIGKSTTEMQPKKSNKLLFLPVRGKDFTLTLQISNFNHIRSGITAPVIIGRTQILSQKVLSYRGLEKFMLGSLLIMILFFTTIYLLKKEKNSEIYFALLLLFASIHLITNGELIIIEIFENLSWELLYRIDFISNYMMTIFFIQYFRKLYPTIFKRFIVVITKTIFGFLTIMTIFTKVMFFVKFLPFYNIITLALLIYTTTTLAINVKKSTVLYSLVGILIVMIAAVNDMLYNELIINTYSVLPIGIIFFILLNSLILNIEFKVSTNEINRINKLTNKIDNIKSRLLKKTSFSLQYPLNILSEEFKANYGILFENNKKDIRPIAVYPSEITSKEPTERIQRMVKECQKSKQAELKLAREKYHEKSILIFPFTDHEKIEYILYLDSYKAFPKNSIELMGYLNEQILGLSENYKLHAELKRLSNNLEAIVAEKTKEVIKQRNNLQQQCNIIEKKSESLEQIYSKIRATNKAITNDIHYALKIHSVLFKSWKRMPEIFPTSFVFFRPKEIIGGDFYLGAKMGEERLFCAADCTGHGIPGALMSIVGLNLLYKAVYASQHTSPEEILNDMQKDIRRILSQDADSISKDGMDLSLINYNPKTKELRFAGARNSGYLVRKGKLIELKADKMSIGGMAHARINKNRKFSLQTIKTAKGDMLYLMSDGYIDQNGGPNERKFMRSRMKKMFIETAEMPLVQQKKHFIKTIDSWRGNTEQMDDMLVAGFRF